MPNSRDDQQPPAAAVPFYHLPREFSNLSGKRAMPPRFIDP